MRALIASFAVASFATTAAAQISELAYEPFSGTTPSYGYSQPSYTPTPNSAIEHHSSTVIGDTGKSVSSIMKAYADGMLSLSQARILMAEAYARERQNRVINTESFLVRKQLLENDRKRQRLESWEWEQQANLRRENRQRNVLYAAYRLRESELSHATGKIEWPAALQRPELETQLIDLEGLFEGLASDGLQYDRVYRDTIDDVCTKLRNDIRSNRAALGMSWEEHSAAQKFVCGLALEAEYWSEHNGPIGTVASR